MKIKLLLLFALAVAACGSPTPSDQASSDEPLPIAFDGALVTQASAQVAHGERLTRVLGCRGCHGPELQGKLFYDVYASNLTRDVHKYNDAQLERVLRSGERIGPRMWAMPSELFQHTSAPDMTGLIAYLRALRPAGTPTQPNPSFSAETRALITAGKIRPATESVRQTKDVAPVDLGPTHALGRYITMLTCAECHGTKLTGGEDTPDLIVIAAYSRAEFETLMTKGVPNGPRRLDLMAMVSQNRFSRMTMAERDALYAYLKARAERPQ